MKITKSKEPILNARQLLAWLMVILYEVVSNLLPYLFDLNVNPVWIMINISIGIVAMTIVALMRAAYPQAVPDKNVMQPILEVIKRIIDTIFDKSKDPLEVQTWLEKIIMWAVREWDALNVEELNKVKDYAKNYIELTKTEKELEKLNGAY